VVVVAVEDWVVDQLHLFLLLVPAVLGHFLLSCLPLAEGRGIGPLDLVHEVLHQFLTETVQRTSPQLFVPLLRLFKPVQRIAD
jgi:hypothetical protein